MNFAVLKKLPVLFVLENNNLSCFTLLRERQPDRPIHGIAKAHGCETYAGDGNDAGEVYAAALEAVERAKRGFGPQFLEFTTFRWLEHCGPFNDDHLGYRTKEEIERGRSLCPVDRMKRKLIQDKIAGENDLKTLEQEIKDEIEAAFRFALASPNPEYKDLAGAVYAD
jgi:pyruvate dehydrogenase E1 component alpha subunit